MPEKHEKLLVELQDQQTKVIETQDAANQAIEKRNEILIETYNAGVPITAIANHIGVSRQVVHKVVGRSKE